MKIALMQITAMVSCQNKCFDKDSNMDNNRYKGYCFGNFPAGEETVSITII